MAVERVSADEWHLFAAVSQIFADRYPSVRSLNELGDQNEMTKPLVEQAFWQAFLDGFLRYGPTRDLLINCRIVLCGQQSATRKKLFNAISRWGDSYYDCSIGQILHHYQSQFFSFFLSKYPSISNQNIPGVDNKSLLWIEKLFGFLRTQPSNFFTGLPNNIMKVVTASIRAIIYQENFCDDSVVHTHRLIIDLMLRAWCSASTCRIQIRRERGLAIKFMTKVGFSLTLQEERSFNQKWQSIENHLQSRTDFLEICMSSTAAASQLLMLGGWHEGLMKSWFKILTPALVYGLYWIGRVASSEVFVRRRADDILGHYNGLYHITVVWSDQPATATTTKRSRRKPKQQCKATITAQALVTVPEITITSIVGPQAQLNTTNVSRTGSDTWMRFWRSNPTPEERETARGGRRAAWRAQHHEVEQVDAATLLTLIDWDGETYQYDRSDGGMCTAFPITFDEGFKHPFYIALHPGLALDDTIQTATDHILRSGHITFGDNADVAILRVDNQGFELNSGERCYKLRLKGQGGVGNARLLGIDRRQTNGSHLIVFRYLCENGHNDSLLSAAANRLLAEVPASITVGAMQNR